VIAHADSLLPATLDAAPSAAEFRDASLWRKLTRSARAAGSQVIEKALLLYYAAQSPSMPAWARTIAFGALAYFIMPADAVPDLLPAAGFTDDLGALVAALVVVVAHVTPEVKAKAKATMARWFHAG
jgi:uncharacterized membrane protein YkvA (DUF1232 family)